MGSIVDVILPVLLPFQPSVRAIRKQAARATGLHHTFSSSSKPAEAQTTHVDLWRIYPSAARAGRARWRQNPMFRRSPPPPVAGSSAAPTGPSSYVPGWSLKKPHGLRNGHAAAWERIESRSHTGYCYYFNHETGMTQWDQPADYKVVAPTTAAQHSRVDGPELGPTGRPLLKTLSDRPIVVRADGVAVSSVPRIPPPTSHSTMQHEHQHITISLSSH